MKHAVGPLPANVADPVSADTGVERANFVDNVIDASLRFARSNPDILGFARDNARLLGVSVDQLLCDAISRLVGDNNPPESERAI